MYSVIRGAAAFLAFFLAVWLGVRFALPVCLPFLLGAGLALLAEPAVRLLNRKLRLPRAAAAGIGVSAVFAAVGLIFLLLGAFLVRELTILAGILPDLTEAAREGLSLLRQWVLHLAEKLPRSIRPLMERNAAALFSGGSALLDRAFRYVLRLAGDILTHVPDSALSLGTGVISAFMISARLPRIRKSLARYFPREKLRPMLRTLKNIRSAAGLWLLAQLKLAGMTLLILTGGLLILRVPYALLWAAGICLLDALPVLGTGVVLIPWSLVCFLQGDSPRGLGLAGIYAVISLSRSVLEPKLVGRHLGLDPLATLFALYAGYQLWGFAGMLAAPLLAVTAAGFFAESRKK